MNPIPTTIKTGDVIACYSGGFWGGVIGWLTPRLRFWHRAPSHVAIVVVDEDRQAWVYESTSLGKMADAIDKAAHAGQVRPRQGVQTHHLYEWAMTYAGRVDLLPLKVPMPRPADAVEYLRDLHTRKVEYDKRAAFRSASPVINSATGDPLFCSALVGFALAKGGSLGTWVNCNELTPWDVRHLECLGKPVTLKEKAKG